MLIAHRFDVSAALVPRDSTSGLATMTRGTPRGPAGFAGGPTDRHVCELEMQIAERQYGEFCLPRSQFACMTNLDGGPFERLQCPGRAPGKRWTRRHTRLGRLGGMGKALNSRSSGAALFFDAPLLALRAGWPGRWLTVRPLPAVRAPSGGPGGRRRRRRHRASSVGSHLRVRRCGPAGERASPDAAGHNRWLDMRRPLPPPMMTRLPLKRAAPARRRRRRGGGGGLALSSPAPSRQSGRMED